MQGSDFDQELFFAAIGRSGARALLIGRRALIALGLPVVTADYDFWLHVEDIETFNRTAAPFGLSPNQEPEAARTAGRYVLENDEHVDVLVARAVPTVDGRRVAFEDLWAERQVIELGSGTRIARPSIAGLILTKHFGARPKDAEDIRLLRVLAERGLR